MRVTYSVDNDIYEGEIVGTYDSCIIAAPTIKVLESIFHALVDEYLYGKDINEFE